MSSYHGPDGVSNKYLNHVNLMIMGLSKHAIQLSWSGRIIAQYSVDTMFSLKGHRYEFGVTLILFRGNISNLSRWKGE